MLRALYAHEGTFDIRISPIICIVLYKFYGTI